MRVNAIDNLVLSNIQIDNLQFIHDQNHLSLDIVGGCEGDADSSDEMPYLDVANWQLKYEGRH